MLQQYTYEVGPEEYLAYHTYHFSHDKLTRRRVKLVRLAVSLGLLLTGVLLFAKGVNAVCIFVFAVLAVCAWMLVPQWMQGSARRMAEKQAQQIRPYQAVTRVEPDGLHIWDGEDTLVVLYDSIESIGEENGFLFFGYGDRRTVVVPPAAFLRGERERADFLTEIRHMVEKCRSGVAEK